MPGPDGPGIRRPRRLVPLAGRTLRIAAAAAAIALPAGCIDLALVGDIAFPSTVPGLPADQPWVSLPVGRWLTESAVQARAISACFAPECRPRAAVGLFEANGPEVDALARSLDDPAELVRILTAPPTGARAARGRVPVPAVKVAVEPRLEGGLSGYAVSLARRDGSRAAFGLVLASRRAGRLVILVIVAPDDGSARRLARDVAPHLGA